MSVAHDDTSSMLEKSMRIMQAFRRSEGSLRFSEIVARTGMPKSTTHRHITALVELEMLDEHVPRLGADGIHQELTRARKVWMSCGQGDDHGATRLSDVAGAVSACL